MILIKVVCDEIQLFQKTDEYQKISCKIFESTKSSKDFRERVKVRLSDGNETPKLLCKSPENKTHETLDEINNSQQNQTLMNETLTANIKLNKNSNTKNIKAQIYANKTLVEKDQMVENKGQIKENTNENEENEVNETQKLTEIYKNQIRNELLRTMQQTTTNIFTNNKIKIVDFHPKIGFISGSIDIKLPFFKFY